MITQWKCYYIEYGTNFMDAEKYAMWKEQVFARKIVRYLTPISKD